MNKFKQLKKITLILMIFIFAFGLSSISLADSSNIISKQVYVKGPTFGTNPDDGSASQVRLYFDYDWLVADETVYNSQLANALALLTVNSYSDSYVASTDSDENINKPGLALELLELENVTHYQYSGSDIETEDVNDIAGVTIGYKKVTLSDGNQVNVVIAVSDTTEGEKEWLSNFDIGADTDDYYASEGTSHSKWENKLNHKGFEVSAVREKSMIDKYLTDYTDHSLKTKLVICGHSRGGALANILGAKYLDEANDDYDIFTYTFGTPNTTEIKGDNTESKLLSYESIFNHVNYDDFVTWIPSSEWGFSRYGITIELRISDSDEMMKKFDDLCWYNLASGYKYPVMEGMMGVGDSFASMFESREDIYKKRIRTLTFNTGEEAAATSYVDSKTFEVESIGDSIVNNFYTIEKKNDLTTEEKFSYAILLKAFAGVLANRNDSSASPIMKFAAYILLASNQDIRTSKCSISFADSKDDELTILLGAMLGNVSNLAPPHYTCSYYLLTMYEYKNVLIEMIPVFNTLPYKEPDLGLDPKPNGSSSSSVTKYATNKLVLTKTGLTSNKVMVLLDEPNAKKGKTVNLQVISDISINVLDVIIKDKNGNKIEITKLNNNEYSFTMPGSDIDIEVIYEEKILREEEQALKEINDKLANEEFKLVASKNKDKINENAKFIEGYEDGTLRLDDEVSNIELMCMTTKLFKDETFDKELKEVNLNQGENYWGEEVLRKASFLNLIPGDKENYDLNKKATRYDMAKAIYDLLGDDKETENKNICKDVTKYEKEISKLMGLGIIKGCDDGLFHGERTLTREEAIVIINRTLRTLGFKLEIKKIETSYRDLSKDRWSYSEIMYATNH